MADPWQLLGLQPAATVEEAHRAYALRMRVLDPAGYQGSAPEVLAEVLRWREQVTEAWETLKTGLPHSAGHHDAMANGQGLYRAAVEQELARSRGAAFDTLELVRGTVAQWNAASARLAAGDCSAVEGLNGTVRERLARAEVETTWSRRDLESACAQSDKYGQKQRLVDQHRRLVEVQALALACYRDLLGGASADGYAAQMETAVAAMESGA